MIPTAGLAGWTAQSTASRCVDNVETTLTVAACAGWLRTDHGVFGNYAIGFDIRSKVAGARAVLGLLGLSERNGRPEFAMGVSLLGPLGAPKPPAGQLQLLSLSEAARAQAMNADGEWQ